MGTFFGRAVLIPDNNGRTFTVDDPFAYTATNGDQVSVPSGFVTDLASIPRALWSFWPPFGRYTAAAIVHDQAYTVQQFSRSRCDDIFYEAMGDSGVDWWTRHCFYTGVRIGGWEVWGKRK